MSRPVRCYSNSNSLEKRSTDCSLQLGWGDGFLNFTLESPAFGFNYGVSGASLTPYLASSTFQTILAQVSKYKSTKTVFVTAQFGHNDQKNPTYEAEFSTSLHKFVSEINAAGGVPIIITPLTRRTFSGGSVVQNLANETAKALAVAKDTGSRYIDLNKASTDYVNAIGNQAAQAYDYHGTDHTHLNPWGEIVFGRMVSDLLVAKYHDIAAYTKPNATLSNELAKGIPA
ncbi:carbohydrate esterase family 12 protein [Oidiodendron maius Zn]|uniref:Carbohydrate esterase family 12 protein n=1 Tax=Oidiodendron maius (strain Zn) TaxID=913774 RepID=A0A0C3HLR1_OIDMZ|nr:carbohydrate esterase family 12 protein [Oidiodendron maius Zn]